MKTGEIVALGAVGYVLLNKAGSLIPSASSLIPSLPSLSSLNLPDVSSLLNYFPQGTVYTPTDSKNLIPYISYTPAITGPLSSNNPDDWMCYLI